MLMTSRPQGISKALFLVFLPVVVLILCIFLPFRYADAGDYHVGSENLYCSDCHAMHYSQDDEVPVSWGTEGPYEQLLKNLTNDMCLMVTLMIGRLRSQART